MIEEPCTRRGEMVRAGFFQCSSNRIIHPEPGVVPLATCGICPYRNLPDREGVREFIPDPRFTTACQHRGAALEVGVCNACGLKGQPFDVYACAKHGTCMVRRFRNDRPDLKVCINCDDFVPADANVAADVR